MSQEFDFPPFFAFIQTRFVLLLSFLILPHTSLFNHSPNADQAPSRITMTSNNILQSAHHPSAYRYVDTSPAHLRDPHSYAYAASATSTAPEPFPLDFPSLYALLPLLCRPRPTRRSTQNTITPISLHPVSRRAKYHYSDQNLACQNLTIEPPRYQYSQIQVVAWPSRDPIEEQGGINLYSFVFNAPTKYYDLLGKEPVEGEDDAPEPTLGFTIKVNPETSTGACGDVKFVIKWKITGGKSHKTLGGYIVQKVTAKWKIDFTCSGEFDVSNWENLGPQLQSRRNGQSFKSPLVYWEAWRVKPRRTGSTGIEPVNTDTFEWNTDAFKHNGKRIYNKGHCGRARMEGEAYYHDGVDKLPGNMRSRNPATWAGDLWSSTNNPNLGGKKGRVVKHWIEFKWNCCNNKKKRTIITDLGPKTDQ